MKDARLLVALYVRTPPVGRIAKVLEVITMHDFLPLASSCGRIAFARYIGCIALIVI